MIKYMNATTLYPSIERLIVEAADHYRLFSTDQLPSLRDARAAYARCRAMVGLAPGVGQWATTDETNAKLGLSGIATVGTTYSPGDEPMRVLRMLGDGWRPVLNGRTITPRLDELHAALDRIGIRIERLTVCPMSTPGCRAGCVIVTAGKGPTPAVVLGRVARWLTLVLHPLHAVRLMRDSIECTVRAAGENHRVRFGVADDVRWERVAPVLFAPVDDVAIRAYAYTKWTPDRRRGAMGLELTYSATREARRWSGASVAEAAAAGRRVAVAVDIRKGQPMPTTFHGAPMVDGDASDDRWSTAPGVVVGLRAKGAARKDSTGFVFRARA